MPSSSLPQPPMPRPSASSTSTQHLYQIPPPKPRSEPEPEGEWTGLDLSNLSLRHLSPTLYTHFGFLKQLHLQGNSLTALSPCIVQLARLEYLDLSGNSLKTLPPLLGRMTWLRELLLYENYINVLPVELGFLYQLETFAVAGNPLIEPLYSMNQTQGGLAVLAFLRDNNTLPTPERQSIPLPPALGENAQASSGSTSFTIFSYNILSEKFATPR